MAERRHQVDTAVELVGRWWLPGALDKAAHGTLQFDPKTGVELQLHELPVESPEGPEEIPLLHGETSEGDCWSLVGCLRTESTFHSRGYPTAMYHAMSAVEGVHLLSADAAAFSAVSVGLSGLEEWIEEDAIAVKGPSSFDDPSYFATFKPVRRMLGALPSAGARLSVSPSTSFVGPNRRTFEIHHRSALTLDFDAPRSVADCQRAAILMRNLLCLLIGKPQQLERLTCACLDPVPGGSPRGASILFKPAMTPPAQRFRPHEMVASAPDLGADTPTVFDNWMAQAESLKVLADLFLATELSETIVEFRLMALTQALEAHHRALVGEVLLMSEAEYRPVRKKLEDAMLSEWPADLQSSIRDRLRYANEPSQRTRLQALIDRLPVELEGELFPDGGPAFVGRVIKARNVFAHQGKPASSQPGGIPGWARLNDKLALIAHALILLQIGVPPTRVAGGIRRMSRWRNAIAE